MRPATLKDFHGIDLRRSTGVADQQTAAVAKNLYLTNGRVWRTRPGTRRLFSCPPQSRGLYAAGGVLRTVAPAGSSAATWSFQRPEFWIDYIEGGAITEFLGAEIYGIPSAAVGVQPYVAVRRFGGNIEHHWVRRRLSGPGGAEPTRIAPGFTPTGEIIKLAEKIFTVDNARGAVRFSSTAFGPENWTEENDAGILPVQRHSSGDLLVQALGVFQGRLVVFFEEQLQIWAVDPQPENFFLVEIMNGPGTQARELVQPVLGDIFFFSRGGFRSLTTQRITGENREGDIGAPIEPRTRELNPGDATASLWWQRLGVYLAAFGSTVFAFTYDRSNRVTGWAEWEFPFEIENLVVSGGRLYARSRDAIYEISDDLEDDDGEPIEWRWESQHLHLGVPDRLKNFHALSIHQRGACQVAMRPDAARPDFISPVLGASGQTQAWQKIPFFTMSAAPAVVLSGTGRWQLDGLTLHFTPLGV